MIIKGGLAVAGSLSMATGFYHLLTQSRIVEGIHPHDLAQKAFDNVYKPEQLQQSISAMNDAFALSQRALDLTPIHMGMVAVGGILLLLALFRKPERRPPG
ncbi:MAG: hypothetical protein HQM02_04135 [Magnetococcales bacterium]|nr:hypothetical protein [Magnetococcales bacterium]